MKKLILMFSVLVILCGCNSSEVRFAQNSVRLHLPGEAREESVDFPYYGEAEGIELLGIKDYSSNIKVEPKYIIDYKKPMPKNDYYILTARVPMFEEMKVEFSTITYKLNEEEKEADVGIFEIEKKGLVMEEYAVSKNYNEEKNEFWIDIKTDGLGELKNVEATNPDIQFETRVQKLVIEEMDTDTRVYVSYPKPKEYDFVTTNFCYTFEKNGKEDIRYGKGFVTFGKDGTIKSSGNFWRSAAG